MKFVCLPTRILGVEMFVTLPRLMLMACLLSPSLSWALGLGEIHLNSSLNEPMNAEIDLIAAAPEELTALRATLAAKDPFTRYGIERPPFLSTLTFKVGKSKEGRDVLLVRSTESIPEPFVTFLVEVNWARGSSSRPLGEPCLKPERCDQRARREHRDGRSDRRQQLSCCPGRHPFED